jgi:hypothetical protein
MVAGFFAKGAGLFVWHIFRTTTLMSVLTVDDPVGVRLADALLPLFFNMRRIAPPAGAFPVFEALLILVFGLQCLVVGLAFNEARRLLLRNRAA